MSEFIWLIPVAVLTLGLVLLVVKVRRKQGD